MMNKTALGLGIVALAVGILHGCSPSNEPRSRSNMAVPTLLVSNHGTISMYDSNNAYAGEISDADADRSSPHMTILSTRRDAALVVRSSWDRRKHASQSVVEWIPFGTNTTPSIVAMFPAEYFHGRAVPAGYVLSSTDSMRLVDTSLRTIAKRSDFRGIVGTAYLDDRLFVADSFGITEVDDHLRTKKTLPANNITAITAGNGTIYVGVFPFSKSLISQADVPATYDSSASIRAYAAAGFKERWQHSGVARIVDPLFSDGTLYIAENSQCVSPFSRLSASSGDRWNVKWQRAAGNDGYGPLARSGESVLVARKSCSGGGGDLQNISIKDGSAIGTITEGIDDPLQLEVVTPASSRPLSR